MEARDNFSCSFQNGLQFVSFCCFVFLVFFSFFIQCNGRFSGITIKFRNLILIMILNLLSFGGKEIYYLGEKQTILLFTVSFSELLLSVKPYFCASVPFILQILSRKSCKTNASNYFVEAAKPA